MMLKNEFLKYYNLHVDKVFNHYVNESDSREKAKQRTYEHFACTWDTIVKSKISPNSDKWNEQHALNDCAEEDTYRPLQVSLHNKYSYNG